MDNRNEFQKRIGVGEPSHAFLRHYGKTRKRTVIKEEGPNRGKPGGYQTDHWDGRIDATVTPDAIRHKINLKGDVK